MLTMRFEKKLQSPHCYVVFDFCFHKFKNYCFALLINYLGTSSINSNQSIIKTMLAKVIVMQIANVIKKLMGGRSADVTEK